MKKLTAFTLICSITLTLAACAEQTALDPQTPSTESRSVAESSATMTQPQFQTTQPDDEVSIEARLREHANRQCFYFDTEWMLDFSFHDDWLNVTTHYFGNILLERAWNERYQEKLGATFEEAIGEFFNQRERFENAPMEEWTHTVECDVFQAYRNLRSDESILGEFSDMRQQLAHRANAWARENDPAFIQLLRYFSITKEEFLREHERRLTELAWLEAREPDWNAIFAVGFFPTEYVDVLFSGDDTAIKRASLNPWSIMVEDRVYSAQWLIDHSPEDWAAEGIPPSEVSRVFEVFRVVLDDEQSATFAAELDVFRREYATS
jgi:hypothetical protein